MKRGKPLKRRTWMRQRRAKPRRSGRVRDRDYLLAVKELPCLLAGPGATWRLRQGEVMFFPCEGPVEADHAGTRPLGRKASDDTAIPLCRNHHWQRTNYMGFFLGFDALFMRGWCDFRIAETRARLLGRAA